MVLTLEADLYEPISLQTIGALLVPDLCEQPIAQTQIVLLYPHELLPMIHLELVVMIETILLTIDLHILLVTVEDHMTEIQFLTEILVTLTETTHQEPLVTIMVQLPLIDHSMIPIPQEIFLIGEVHLMTEPLVMNEVILEQRLMADLLPMIVVMKKGEIQEKMLTALQVDTLPELKAEVGMQLGDTRILCESSLI